MFVTFMYMDLCIFVKWNTDWTGKTDKAPSIIGLMIDMPLKSGDPILNPLYGNGKG